MILMLLIRTRNITVQSKKKIKNNENTQHMIVEAQLLLRFLLKAKKMGHKVYSIIRQNELIRNVKIKYYN